MMFNIFLLYNVDQLEILRVQTPCFWQRWHWHCKSCCQKSCNFRKLYSLNGLNTFGGTDLAIDSNHILDINSDYVSTYILINENHRDHFFGKDGYKPFINTNFGSGAPESIMNTSHKDLLIEGSLHSMVLDTSLRNTAFGNPDFITTLEAEFIDAASYQMSDTFKANLTLQQIILRKFIRIFIHRLRW